MCLFLEPLIFGEARARRTDALWDTISKKAFFKIPFYKLNPTQKEEERTLTPTAMLARSQFLLCPTAPFFVSGREIFWLTGKISAPRKKKPISNWVFSALFWFYSWAPCVIPHASGPVRVGARPARFFSCPWAWPRNLYERPLCLQRVSFRLVLTKYLFARPQDARRRSAN